MTIQRIERLGYRQKYISDWTNILPKIRISTETLKHEDREFGKSCRIAGVIPTGSRNTAFYISPHRTREYRICPVRTYSQGGLGRAALKNCLWVVLR